MNHTWSKVSSIVAGLLAMSLLVYACKNEEEVQYPPPNATNTASLPPPPPPPDAGTPQPAPDAGPTALDPVTAQGISLVIAERAKQDAKGMQPVGELIGGVVPAGGRVEGAILMDAGKCYAVVATGGPGIVELDLEIQAKPSPSLPLPGPVIAVDSNTGITASITPCWKNAFPVPFSATLVVKATQGQGPVGAQLYVK